MITFDPSINFGHIMEALVIAVGGLGVIYTIKADLKSVKSDVSELQQELKKMSDVMVVLGRQDERLNAMDKRIDAVS